MVVKLLILTLITRSKLYQKQVKSTEPSLLSNQTINSKKQSPMSESSLKNLQKAEKVLNQGTSLLNKYIPEQKHILQLIDKEKENVSYLKFRG